MATLENPQGSADVIDNGEVIATVKAGEHFLATPASDGWSVYLKSGLNGYIDKVKLHLLPDEPLMKLSYEGSRKKWREWQSAPESKQLSEGASAAKGRGVNYYKTLVQASNGDLKAMARFFSLARFMDGGAAEGYYPDEWELLHVVGDDGFARFLSTQPAKVRQKIGGTLASPGDTEPISKPKPYIKQYFPKSYRILFDKSQKD